MKNYRILIVALTALLVFGCSKTAEDAPQIASPTDTLKNFIEASKKKDAGAIRQTLSSSSLALVETVAQAQKTTSDELLSRGNTDMVDEMPDIRNEKIENDTATVEVKIKTTGYDTIPFVKENGVWKIAFDKYQQAMMDKMRQEMKTPAPSASPGGAAKTPAPANKPAAKK